MSSGVATRSRNANKKKVTGNQKKIIKAIFQMPTNRNSPSLCGNVTLLAKFVRNSTLRQPFCQLKTRYHDTTASTPYRTREARSGVLKKNKSEKKRIQSRISLTPKRMLALSTTANVNNYSLPKLIPFCIRKLHPSSISSCALRRVRRRLRAPFRVSMMAMRRG